MSLSAKNFRELHTRLEFSNKTVAHILVRIAGKHQLKKLNAI